MSQSDLCSATRRMNLGAIGTGMSSFMAMNSLTRAAAEVAAAVVKAVSG